MRVMEFIYIKEIEHPIEGVTEIGIHSVTLLNLMEVDYRFRGVNEGKDVVM